MPHNAGPHIDFDDWSKLAARDPAAFEARRAQVLEEFILQAPAERQERLRRLQWRVDMIRRGSANPVAACVKISRLMWDSLLGDDGLLEALERLSGRPRRTPAPAPRAPAAVIPFRHRH